MKGSRASHEEIDAKNHWRIHTENAVRAMESWTSPPPIDGVYRIAERLGVTPGKLRLWAKTGTTPRPGLVAPPWIHDWVNDMEAAVNGQRAAAAHWYRESHRVIPLD